MVLGYYITITWMNNAWRVKISNIQTQKSRKVDAFEQKGMQRHSWAKMGQVPTVAKPKAQVQGPHFKAMPSNVNRFVRPGNKNYDIPQC